MTKTKRVAVDAGLFLWVVAALWVVSHVLKSTITSIAN